jgi:hypothetical protein
MNPPIGASYLVETSYEDAGTLRVFDAEALTAYLTSNIENMHYSGEADTLHGIYRYVSPGALCELILVHVGQIQDDNDYLHSSYALHEKADSEGFGECDDNKVLSFTVRTDGRA